MTLKKQLVLYGLSVFVFFASPAFAKASIPVIPINKKVFLLIFNPYIGSQKLTDYEHWNDPDAITSQIISTFQTASGQKLNFTIAQRQEFAIFPPKTDGFTYDQTSYLSCMANSANCHADTGQGLTVDYSAILSTYHVCDALNSGQVDELWVWGGPYFGYWESTLTGPNAFWYNSPPITNSTCQHLMPIMGFSYEVGTDNAVHDFGHRTESALAQVYGSWQENSVANNWDKFALVKVQSPNFTYSGCGSTHYPPNAQSDYDYGNTMTVASNCDDFYNYPNLSDPLRVLKNINCTTWGCSQLGYFNWWFSHLPSIAGFGLDGKLNDWWEYMADPNIDLNLPQAQSNLLINNSTMVLTAPAGANFTLNWNSEFAPSCVAGGSWSGTQNPSGAVTLTVITGLHTYSLTCGNSAVMSVTVQTPIVPSPTPSFTLSQLNALLSTYMGLLDASYWPQDGKINMLDAGYVIHWVH